MAMLNHIGKIRRNVHKDEMKKSYHLLKKWCNGQWFGFLL
jgi:hypothetical protein